MKTFFVVLRIASVAVSFLAMLKGDMEWACWFLIHAVIFLLEEKFYKKDDDDEE